MIAPVLAAAAAVALAAASGAPGLLLKRGSRAGQLAAVGLLVPAAGLGLTAALAALASGARTGGAAGFPWPAAAGAPAGVDGGLIGLDALSGFFLVPIFLMGLFGSVYGLGYWPAARRRDSRPLQFFWGTLTAGLALLAIARHALTFLLGWEAMALSAFFLIATEHELPEARKAAWIYFIATHIGTLALFGLFALWRRLTGSFALVPIGRDLVGLAGLNALFALALLAFGLKAGMMPLHFWLPTAHAAAPSHVSAMLSGVVLKMGIYGLVRFLSFLPDPPAAWGALILGLGVASGLLGVAFAIAQHDLKRLLAYHSVENIGIILMGLGLAMLGRSAGRPDWVVLGLAGCLLHVWNHSLFKCLLFLGAGAVVNAAGTRRIDRLGGLAKTMPWTAALFLAGALAICGLPPFNGFVSELLVYLGLFGALDAAAPAAAVAAPALAMVGALALACFVKVYGTVFLGEARASAPADSRGPSSRGTGGPPRDPPRTMLAPMLVLAGLCLAIGLAPGLAAGALDAAIAAWAAPAPIGLPGLASLAPLGAVGLAALALGGAGAAAVLAFRLLRPRPAAGPTWDCGYAAPTARMQYTASSFARSIVGLFAWALKPVERPPAVEGVLPSPASLSSHVDDTVLDRWLAPAAARFAGRAAWFRRFQQGLIQSYLLYVLIVVVALLATLIPYRDIIAKLFAR